MTAIAAWTVRYHPTGSSDDVIMRSHDANVNEDVLMGLDKGTSYTVLVAASNSAGIGPFTEEVASTMIDRKWCFDVVLNVYCHFHIIYVAMNILRQVHTCSWFVIILEFVSRTYIQQCH